MSISMTVPQIQWLPTIFSEQLIQSIQHQVQTYQQLITLISQHQPQIKPNKNLPIVKQQFFKQLVKKQSIQQSLTQLYSFMTQHNYTVEQKFYVLNLVYKLIYLISEIGMGKEEWKNIVQREIEKLTKRIIVVGESNKQQKQSSSQTQQKICQAPILTIHQAQQLKVYINKNITQFYQIWQKLLDQNQKFTINTKFYQPLDTKYNNLSLINAKKLQINEILALDCLKQFISDKPPIQQKKDVKKK